MPTALELKREGWQRFKGLGSRIPELQILTHEEQQERERVLGKVRELAKILKSRFGLKRVVLFGSLAGRAPFFRADSDIDLALEGLKMKEYWEAWRLAEEFIVDRQIDIVELEMASESLKGAINLYGVEL